MRSQLQRRRLGEFWNLLDYPLHGDSRGRYRAPQRFEAPLYVPGLSSGALARPSAAALH